MYHFLGIAPIVVTLPTPDATYWSPLTNLRKGVAHIPNMLHSLRILLPLLSVLMLLAACSPAASAPTTVQSDGERLRVVASISPIANIVYNIGGNRIDLASILPPGVDPHTFEPRPSDAVKLAQADLVFVNGLHLDESTLRLAQANLKEGAEIVQLAVEVAEADELIYGLEYHQGHGEQDEVHDDDDHDVDENGHAEEDDDHSDDDDEQGHANDDDDHADSDGPSGGDGEEGEPDPHLVLDPNFAMLYAKIVLDSLTAHEPGYGAYYRANFDEYTARLQALDEGIRATTATIPELNRRLLTYHDSFGYFGRRYGYTIVGAIQPSDTAEPSAQEVAALIEQLRAEGVPAIFGSALFSANVLEQISSATGVTVNTLLDEDLPGEPGDLEPYLHWQ